MTCEICHTTEIYAIRDHFDPETDEHYTSDYLVKFSKNDAIEPGRYECVNGHEILIEPENE